MIESTTTNANKTFITFTGRVPSKKNHLRRIKRGNRTFTIASEEYCEWESIHVSELLESGIKKLIPPYSITYRIYAPDRRVADITNKLEGINDALVKAEIIQDDNWFLLGDINAKFMGVDRTNPRIELEICSSDENVTELRQGNG